MLHLAIIGVVCAVSALSEGTAIIGGKNSERNALSDFEGEAKAGNGAEPSLARVYHVDARNCSTEEKITNRTSCFDCDRINEQCPDSRSSSCSVRENASAGEEKEPVRGGAGIGFRKRNLLRRGRRSVNPSGSMPTRSGCGCPSESGCKKCGGCRKCGKCGKPKCPRPKCPRGTLPFRRNKNRWKKLRFGYKDIGKVGYVPQNLKSGERWRLRKLMRPGKKAASKRNLDKVKVDDELDLNKRIEKLVGEIAAENQRAATMETPATPPPGSNTEAVACGCGRKSEKKCRLPGFFKRLKNFFLLKKGKCDNQNDVLYKTNSVPVNTVRRAKPVAETAARISSFDVLKTLRKTTRFRRNPHGSSVSSGHSGTPIDWSWEKPNAKSFSGGPADGGERNPLSRHGRGKLPTQTKRRRLTRHPSQKRRRVWAKNVNDVRSKRQNQYPWEPKDDGDSSGPGKSPENGPNKPIERLKEKPDPLSPEKKSEDTDAEDDESDVPEHTLEKPFEKDFGRDDPDLKAANEKDLKKYEARYNLQTEFPLFYPTALHPYRRYKYDLPEDGFLNPFRYLKIRHALRNYLIHNNVLSPLGLDAVVERKKRCGMPKGCCPVPHRCWRSPPLLCLPYIKKGQDDLLRYLIRTMQSMIGKPFPPKIDIFENTKFKPCARTDPDPCDDATEDEEFKCCTPAMSSETPPCPPPCSPPCPLPCPDPCPPFSLSSAASTARRCLCPNNTPKLRSCTSPLLLIPKSYRSHLRPCFPNQRSSLYDRYAPPREFIAPSDFYPPVSPRPYSYDAPDQIVYPNSNCCYQKPPLSAPPLPYLPYNPYPPGPLTPTEPPLRYQAPNPPFPEPNYAPTPPSNPLPRLPEPTPLPYTRPPLSSPSTMNACSWYMSKSPLERAEYFAFTALPFNAPPETATEPYQLVRSDPLPSPNFRPPCPPPMTQANQFAPQKSKFDLRSTNAKGTTAPGEPPLQLQSVGGHYLYENQYRDKHRNEDMRLPYEVYPEQTAQYGKEGPGRRNFQMGESPLKEGEVKCDDQQHQVIESDMQKPEVNYAYSKGGAGKEVTMNAVRCSDQQVGLNDRQISKADASEGYGKPYSSEQNSQMYKGSGPEVVQNAQQPPVEEANDGYTKNLNREDAYRCGYQQCSGGGAQQMPRTEASASYPKNLNKEDTFKSTGQHNTASVQQGIKADVVADNGDKRFFKTKYYKNLLKPFRRSSLEFSPAYDDDYYKFPPAEEEDVIGDRLNRAPFPRNWKGYGPSLKKASNRGSSTRHKRDDDYYAWPGTFQNYDYDSDFSYSDAALVDSAGSDDNPPDPRWILPSYEMFNELAKSMKKVNATSDCFTSLDEKCNEPKKKSNATANDHPSHSANTTVVIATLRNASKPSNSSCLKATVAPYGGTTAPPKSVTTAAAASSPNSVTTPAAPTSSCCDPLPDDEDENVDSKKSGKPGFFQTNSKHLPPSKVSDLGSSREDKELDGSQDLDSVDESQVPTTLKMATIVKGPKKSMTKPSPKVYIRVYPDSLAVDTGSNETTTTTPATTTKPVLEKTTQSLGSSSNAQLQLLAVCEAYLEVVKLIKAQNQTLGDELDADLARYCENIISQNFNLQSETSKPKKKPANPCSQSGKKANATSEPCQDGESTTDANTEETTVDDFPDEIELREEVERKKLADAVNVPLTERELVEGGSRGGGERERGEESGGGNDGELALGENKSGKRKGSYRTGKRRSKLRRKKRRRYRRKEQTDEEVGITKEQAELLRLLKKRKRALLSWLYNSKEAPGKPSDAQETEYFDDDDFGSGSNTTDSGTITPKVQEKASSSTESLKFFVNESIFPVYAKQYGYDKGGELTEVEVLWRKVNEKTHEKKIFKNLSVLALLLTSTVEPTLNRDDTRFIGSGLLTDEMSEIQSKNENKAGFADAVASFSKKTSTVPTAPTVLKTQNASYPNDTYTFVSKPDPKSIVGAPPNCTVFHPNTTHKISHKFGAAKDLFQEYTIEFLNYAVYILPIMFTVLFIFCCLCCAVQILKSGRTSRKLLKKKRPLSTDTETSESECGSKKKRREARRKKHSKGGADYDALEKKGSRAFWNVLRLHSGKGNAESNDEIRTEKRRSFLRFLKGRKEEGKGNFSGRYAPVREADEHCDVTRGSGSDYQDSGGGRRRRDEKAKTYSQSEAEERRELIALLEELKKIETENTGEKKEVKSVHVQYMTQEDEGPVFQRPEFSFPYQKNVFGMPKGYSPCNKHFPFYRPDPAGVREYELFDDVNELTELLPCDCNYYAKRNDYLRQCDFKVNREGGCKSLIKIFRDAGMTHSAPFREKNLFKNESENRSFIFNKYRSISTDTSEELMGVTQKNAGTELRLTDNVSESASPLALQSKKNAALAEEMDTLKRHLNNKKHVRLKDNGVLCRL